MQIYKKCNLFLLNSLFNAISHFKFQ